MAFDESEVPESVRDILASMPRDMRQRVLADYESHYAPFLAMLAGWKGAVQTHYALGEASAVARLQEQFFPLGDWRFPAQALAVPQRPAERTTEIAFNAAFQDPGLRAWTACGEGWLHPTALRSAPVRVQENTILLALNITALGSGDTIAQRGQLAFIAADEAVVAALQCASWWAQADGGAIRPARLRRYEGWLEFEREMQTARINQRQLDLWLPPCHPYTRKFVCLQLADAEFSPGTPPDFAGLADPDANLRFLARLESTDARTLSLFHAMEARTLETPLFHLNAVPVVQTGVSDSVIPAPFPRVGQEYGLRLSGLANVFAAVAYNDNTRVPASMTRVAGTDPVATIEDMEVRFAQSDANVARVKLYHGSVGQGRADREDTPSSLERAGVRFALPFPALGGVSVGGAENRAEWARAAWYHSVLRPPLLTEGDLHEVVRQRSQGVSSNWLRLRGVARGISREPDTSPGHWRSYLWPSIYADEAGFQLSQDGLTQGFVPLIQSLRLLFEPTASGARVPGFLLSDVANYLASVISQYFVLSCFRIEAQVGAPSAAPHS